MTEALEAETAIQHALFTHIPKAAHGVLTADLLATSGEPVIHIAANDRELDAVVRIAQSYAPELEIVSFPAWDCLPYDRVSPAPAITAQRVACLSALAAREQTTPILCVTTIGAIMQKVPPRDIFAHATRLLRIGDNLAYDELLHYLMQHGYSRVSTVMEPGECSFRGHIVDIFPSGAETAVRIDCFGEDIESIRQLDPISQRSGEPLAEVMLYPMSEILLNEQHIDQFRSQYRQQFGAVPKQDLLYEAISQGRSYTGMEHWLPLFYQHMDTLFDYLPGAILSYDTEIEQIFHDRQELLQEYYLARREAPKDDISDMYHPVPPDMLYLNETHWRQARDSHSQQAYSLHAHPEGIDSHGYGLAPKLISDVKSSNEERLKAVKTRAEARDKPLVIACYSTGSATRIADLLQQQSVPTQKITHLADAKNAKAGTVSVCTLPIEYGATMPAFILLSEQDVLGERIIRTTKRKRASEAFMQDAASFEQGQLVVHREHGIGRFDGLITLEVGGNKHDCLKLVYAGDDKLFLPVVNMELINSFGNDSEGVQLDKLGSVGWQKRKAAMKERIKLAAEELLKIAAKRATREAAIAEPPQGLYQEFCDRFAFNETEDQQRAIDETLEDLAKGTPMDRLICGDVGFGKTEVALRAAMAIALSEPRKQVAMIAPTTLLARQHYQNFKARFEGFDVTIRHLSRMVSAKEQQAVRQRLKDGSVDIVIGTHALLSKQVTFANLGLVIVDEEQRFGVDQKEKLKRLRANVHVLTLSATPIPRTLQMALSGVRELSLITTPPVDRLAVRSFVMPYDGVVIKEAIMREFHRGGKVFYVTPRIEYLEELEQRIKSLVPDVSIAIAHGQMSPNILDNVVQDFYDGKYDLLLSTAIVESGLDVPQANTIIIDRAHLFGLAQLYQLRGRVGRGKTRAYAYFTLPARKQLTANATKRLEVMSQLDTLGAGFTLASHDMDIRGFGNLLGEEQSGHVREVGVELYQHMLEETIEKMKRGESPDEEDSATSEEWSPQIQLPGSALIPESYVQALDVRMGLYRRLAHLHNHEDIDSFAAELMDRFGEYPAEVTQLLNTLRLKTLCKQAGIARIDTGPKGAVITFRGDAFARPDALLHYITQQPKKFKIRHDQKLVIAGPWKSEYAQLSDIEQAVADMAAIAVT